MTVIKNEIRWATNAAELKKDLLDGVNSLTAMKTAVDRTVSAMGGTGLFGAANKVAAAITQLGGATKLTAAEQGRANDLLDKAVQKYKAMGIAAPTALVEIRDALTKNITETKRLADQTTLADKASGLFTGTIGRMAAAFSISGLIDKAVGSLISFGKEAIASAGALTDMSAKTGLSVETLQRFDFVGKQAGVTVDQFADAAFKLGVKLSTGSGSTREAVEKLGLSFQDIKALSPDEQFDKIVAALERMEDPQERNRLGVELFGKSFASIAPAVAAGYSDMAKSAEVSSKAQIKAIDDASDALDRFIAKQKTRFTSALGNAILLHDAVAKLPEGYAKFLLDTDKSIKTVEDLNAALIRAAGGMDISAKGWSDGKTAIADLSGELLKAKGELAGLTIEQRKQIQAGIALHKSTDDIANSVGISDVAVRLYSDQLRSNEEAQRKNKEEQKRAAAEALKLVEKIHELEFGYSGLSDALDKVGKSSGDLDFVRAFTKNFEAAKHVEDGIEGIGDALSKVGLKVPPIEENMQRMFQRWADASRDMRREWADTWESALSGTQSFGSAFVDTLKTAIVNPFRRMLADLIADWQARLLAPMLNMFSRSMASMYASQAAFSLGRDAAGVGATAGLAGAAGGGGAGGMGAGAAGAAGWGSAAAMAGYAGIGIGSWYLGSYLGGKVENKYAGAALGAGAGAATGALVGSVVPGVGTGIGAGVGAIAGAIAGWRAAGKMYEEVKKQQADLMAQFGGIEGQIKAVGLAYAHMGKTGLEAEAALHKMWNAKTPQEFADAVKPVAEALDKFQKDTVDIKAGVDGVINAGRAFGRQLPDHLQVTIKKLMEMKGITEEQKKALQDLLDNAKPNFAELTSKAAGFGISLEALGPKFQQVSIEARSKELSDFLTDATQAGGDVGGMLEGLQDEISALVNDSLKFGSAIPDNMKPYITELARAGKLTDENGNKIEDLTGLKWEETPLDKGLKNLTDSIDHLADVLDGVPSKIDKVGEAADAIPDNPYANWRVPEQRSGPDGYGGYGALGGLVTRRGIVQYFGRGVSSLIPRGTDTVPAMLTPGESVLTRQATERLGADAIRDLNRGGPYGRSPSVVVTEQFVFKPVIHAMDGANVQDVMEKQLMPEFMKTVEDHRRGYTQRLKRILAT